MSTYVNYTQLLADGNIVLLDASADAISLFSQAGVLVPHINLMQFFTFLYAVLLSRHELRSRKDLSVCLC